MRDPAANCDISEYARRDANPSPQLATRQDLRQSAQTRGSESGSAGPRNGPQQPATADLVAALDACDLPEPVKAALLALVERAGGV
jgi:hypothetical protein